MYDHAEDVILAIAEIIGRRKAGFMPDNVDVFDLVKEKLKTCIVDTTVQNDTDLECKVQDVIIHIHKEDCDSVQASVDNYTEGVESLIYSRFVVEYHTTELYEDRLFQLTGLISAYPFDRQKIADYFKRHKMSPTVVANSLELKIDRCFGPWEDTYKPVVKDLLLDELRQVA